MQFYYRLFFLFGPRLLAVKIRRDACLNTKEDELLERKRMGLDLLRLGIADVIPLDEQQKMFDQRRCRERAVDNRKLRHVRCACAQ